MDGVGGMGGCIERGAYGTVTGPSGSGKSTFLNVLGLLDRPTAGRYLLDGPRAALRGRRIGFVFQAFHLLGHRTAAENVQLPMVYARTNRRSRRALAAEALTRVGLSARGDQLAARLSGGERQRVAIARALVNGPSLLLCDEPTGNLDSATAAAVLALLDDLHLAGMTLLVVSHDPDVAARAGRTVTIHDGVLREAART